MTTVWQYIEFFVRNVESLTIVVTLVFAIVQVRSAARERRHAVYERINSEYVQHMWRVGEYPELEKVWVTIAEQRKKDLESAQSRKGGAWKIMNVEEKRCYRFVRIALEIFESAFAAEVHGAPERYCKKWGTWMRVFKGSDYFRFVFADTDVRFMPGFNERLLTIDPTFFPERSWRAADEP